VLIKIFVYNYFRVSETASCAQRGPSVEQRGKKCIASKPADLVLCCLQALQRNQIHSYTRFYTKKFGGTDFLAETTVPPKDHRPASFPQRHPQSTHRKLNHVGRRKLWIRRGNHPYAMHNPSRSFDDNHRCIITSPISFSRQGDCTIM
jgi:hypothetical protein